MPIWLGAVINAIIIMLAATVYALFAIWMERKVAGLIQGRIGPYMVGEPHGYLQSVADAIKLLGKEDIMPAQADKWVWWLAPVLIFIPAILFLVPIPFGPGLAAADLNVGVLFIIAVSSLTLLAEFMAGWGSNSKYSLIGSLRTVAQLMSYEIPMALAIVGVVMAVGSLNLGEIVAAQSDRWFVFPQFLGFIVFFIAAAAESARIPFDLPEGESELVAGHMTEYSGLRWSFFMLAEYVALFGLSALGVVLYLGGWHGPAFLPPVVWFLIKTISLVIVAMWIGWTLPRVRIDHLMDLGWKFLIPVSLINIVITAVYIVL